MPTIWYSYSKSATARRPRTIMPAPHVAGAVDQKVLEGMDDDLGPRLGRDGGDLTIDQRHPLLQGKERALVAG
jgi:hypothetical protein